MGSGKFYILLEDSANFQNLLKLLLAWKRKFQKVPDFSGNFHDNAFLILDN